MLRVSDLGSGLAIAGLGLAIFIHAQTFPSVGGVAIGPSFYPGLIGVVLMICGLALAGQSIRQRKAFPLAQVFPWIRKTENVLAVISIPVAILVYGLASPSLGFIATCLVVSLGLLLVFRVKWWMSILVASGLTAMLYVTFVIFMRVPLPYGIVERWLS
ncbi:tripartite tricarboxylate transporter TctB family protein [Acuticoccus kandeliae]|uniref:tripartite tricarboxylate transporter TctB family protein n=1 Tax=Acuticoccus kandeliae TaxID=2073160 RepID=UPI000D3EC726|nr:tripartite tricarboxylate transporter TctB family protein [Acuticoccus kandeliae]